MEPTTALLIAIPVLVVLAGVLLFATARRRDTGEAIGALARETKKRDRGSVAVLEGDEAPPATGKEVERAAVIERREASQALATVGATAPVPWVPPDPEVLGVTRRQFFNRGIVTFFGLGLAGFGAACLAFLWPQLGEGFGGIIKLGSTADVDTKIAAGGGFAYYPEGRMWVTHYPAVRTGRRRAPCTHRPRSSAWRRATRRSTRSASTSAAGCRSARRLSGSSASATARSTTATARRRAGPRRVASTASRWSSRAAT